MANIASILTAIQEADKNGVLKNNDVLTGFSGHKFIGTLQRLSNLQLNEAQCYLEIGVFQGLTLLSVASVTEYDTFGIDNFAFFDPEKKNYSIVKNRISKLNLSNVHLINSDYEDALEGLEDHLKGRKIGLYLVDGPHDYRSQLVCLLKVLPYLSNDAVIIVDDCNYAHVRQANQDFLKSFPNFKLLFEAYTTCHPKNMNSKEKVEAREGWWNGINVLVKDERNELPFMYPSTKRSRATYENEHILHSVRFPESLLDGAKLAEAYSKKSIKDIIKKNYHFLKRYKKDETARSYEYMNTESENLPKSNYNKIIA